ncbi:MAG: hypothetical protein PHO23_00665 [Candidatus Pacebacteria bacterium]|nr:hypothetical protein [Candidatus Paceibacterota bacterium]
MSILHVVLGVTFFVVMILFTMVKVYIVMNTKTPLFYYDEDKNKVFLKGMTKILFSKGFWKDFFKILDYSRSEKKFNYIQYNIFKPNDHTIKESSVFSMSVILGGIIVVVSLLIMGQRHNGWELVLASTGVAFVFLGWIERIFCLSKEVKSGSWLTLVLLVGGVILQLIACIL